MVGTGFFLPRVPDEALPTDETAQPVGTGDKNKAPSPSPPARALKTDSHRPAPLRARVHAAHSFNCASSTANMRAPAAERCCVRPSTATPTCCYSPGSGQATSCWSLEAQAPIACQLLSPQPPPPPPPPSGRCGSGWDALAGATSTGAACGGSNNIWVDGNSNYPPSSVACLRVAQPNLCQNVAAVLQQQQQQQQTAQQHMLAIPATTSLGPGGSFTSSWSWRGGSAAAAMSPAGSAAAFDAVAVRTSWQQQLQLHQHQQHTMLPSPQGSCVLDAHNQPPSLVPCSVSDSYSAPVCGVGLAGCFLSASGPLPCIESGLLLSEPLQGLSLHQQQAVRMQTLPVSNRNSIDLACSSNVSCRTSVDGVLSPTHGMTGQRVGMCTGSSDVAAVAAALAQDKLAQLQALEDMQQQLFSEVAHLLPLI